MNRDESGGVAPAAALDAALRRSPLFGALTPQARDQLRKLATQRTLGPKEVLWRKGERARSLGIILAGRLAFSRQGAAGDRLFEVAKEGDLIGDVGFALSSTYSSTAWCPRRARVALLPSGGLRRILEAEPAALSALALQLATRVSRLLNQIDTLTALSVDRRLARTLLSLADQLGQAFPGGTLIPVKLRRADLAALCATTLETTSRKMTEWERQGLLTSQPAGMVLRDLEALRHLAEG